jgi:hypothetical protein
MTGVASGGTIALGPGPAFTITVSSPPDVDRGEDSWEDGVGRESTVRIDGVLEGVVRAVIVGVPMGVVNNLGGAEFMEGFEIKDMVSNLCSLICVDSLDMENVGEEMREGLGGVKLLFSPESGVESVVYEKEVGVDRAVPVVVGGGDALEPRSCFFCAGTS